MFDKHLYVIIQLLIFAALFAVAAAAYIKTPASVVDSSEEMASSELASSEPSDSTSSLYSATTYFATVSQHLLFSCYTELFT